MQAYFLSIVAGLFSGIVGVGYRVGSKGKVFPIQTAMLLYFAGMLVFSFKADFNYVIPLSVWIAGICGGLTQYATVRLLRSALQRGPLSPAWCAVGLSFVPVLIYCWLFKGENLSILQMISVAATLAAIVIASVGNAKNAESTHKLANKKEMFIYGLLLVLILAFCGVLNIVLKIADYEKYNGGTLIEAFGNQIMAITYLFMFIPSVLDLSLSKTWRINRYFWLGGAFVAVGGVALYGIQIFIMDAPAVVVFALSGVTSLLLASLVSVFVFREKASWYWYATVILAVLAILTNR